MSEFKRRALRYAVGVGFLVAGLALIPVVAVLERVKR